MIDLREMMHTVAQTGPLSGGIFQGDSHGRRPGRGEYFVKTIDDPAKAFRIAGPEMRSRMNNQEGQAERSEEHTSELQSLTNLVCRLLLEKKKKKSTQIV